MNKLSALFLITCCCTQIGCWSFIPKPDFKPHDKLAVLPQEFLFSTYGPLNDYLDTPVHVQITEMPLSQVFYHPTLSRLNYHFVRMPAGDPLITIQRIGVTRRQLLWSLAQDHSLNMLPVTRRGGDSYIEVRARSN